MTTHRLIPAADFRVMPWKNGLGETIEIARSPAGSTGLDDFDWRMSIAPVVADGAFSTFPGVQRTIVVVEGNGMELELADGRAHRLEPFKPFTYDGGMAVHGRLIDGPVRDLNMMVRRDKLRGGLQVIRENRFRYTSKFMHDVRAIVAYALSGNCECGGEGWSERLLEGNALLVEGTNTIDINSVTPSPLLVLGHVTAAR